MLAKLRGYSTVYLAGKTAQLERGLYNYPYNLRTDRDDPDSELDYEQFFAHLEAAGVNRLCIQPSGRQWPWPGGKESWGIEPPPAGTFNIWHNVLDTSDLEQYRASQITQVSADLWARSNLGQMVEAAEQHGVKFHLIPFESAEWRAQWRYHAWNANNYYTNGVRCEPQDRGWLQHAREVFTDQRAIDAAKTRIDFIIDAFAGHNVIASWQLCSEMTWMVTDLEGVWGVDSWREMRAIVDNQIIPWVDEMAQHIKARHSAPVSNGHAFVATGTDFSSDPYDWRSIVNAIFDVPSLDFVMAEWYRGGDLVDCHRWLRSCQEYFGKPIYIVEYAPYPLQGRDQPWREESSPFPQSKAHEWLLVCGEYGVTGPIRWPGIREDEINWWSSGGWACPGMMEIAGVTRQFADAVDLDDWSGRGRAYEDDITASGATLVSAWGDGRHVALFVQWSDDSDHSLSIAGLDDGEYDCWVFDWISGDQIDWTRETCSGGVLDVGGIESADRATVAYLSPVSIPEPPTSETTTLRMMLQEVRDGAVVREWAVPMVEM